MKSKKAQQEIYEKFQIRVHAEPFYKRVYAERYIKEIKLRSAILCELKGKKNQSKPGGVKLTVFLYFRSIFSAMEK